ncbi:hypothetical protein ACGYLI_05155 [Sulfitobacter sp. 1A13421]|uniref:hypothetical protein n=1 Tax=Sulfitobacter sp. 1A13421 TaxID=3368595 RepID=UPI003747593E
MSSDFELTNLPILRPKTVLPFILVWYGWLSESQGALAKELNLIVVVPLDDPIHDQVYVRLSHIGRRYFRKRICGPRRLEAGYALASLYRELGHLSTEKCYIYKGVPLGSKADHPDLQTNRDRHFSLKEGY